MPTSVCHVCGVPVFYRAGVPKEWKFCQACFENEILRRFPEVRIEERDGKRVFVGLTVNPFRKDVH
jgi:hypothetical protein